MVQQCASIILRFISPVYNVQYVYGKSPQIPHRTSIDYDCVHLVKHLISDITVDVNNFNYRVHVCRIFRRRVLNLSGRLNHPVESLVRLIVIL